jgi:hypothetical protein
MNSRESPNSWMMLSPSPTAVRAVRTRSMVVGRSKRTCTRLPPAKSMSTRRPPRATSDAMPAAMNSAEAR